MVLNSSYSFQSGHHTLGGGVLPQVAQQGHSAEVPGPHGSHPFGGDAAQGDYPLADDALTGGSRQLVGGEARGISLLLDAVEERAQDLIGIPFAVGQLGNRVARAR